LTLAQGQWTMLTITRAGSTLSCYRNGALVSRNTSFSATYTADSSVRIGNSTAFNEPTNGALDDVRIYNRALSATEVKQLYNAGR
jgi:Concanavalin A-like lectin/glucanases superfamily